ncbi:FIG00536496: hypothetical protein [hydrothermal vent metagenome]|uniref:Lipoprotein n=1 Tax=hydrothermal vent metagenome TaxID=652676 RepID=A0A3B0YFJ2_9ZZZZ
MKTVSLFKARYLTGLMLVTLLLLSGCGNRFEEDLRLKHKSVKAAISYLEGQIVDRQMTNILLIIKYANRIIQIKPDYKDVALLLKKESTTEGKAFQSLLKRLNSVNLVPTSEAAAAQSLQELQLISVAADEVEFNNNLADVVNTLASFSDGELAVVDVPASDKSSAQKVNALVGNPSYGNWQRGSDGRSFWEWYGMYAMFSNLTGSRYYYDSWSSRPHYSYYNRYGRTRWGSGSDVSRNYNLSKSYPSKYNKPSAATKSRYATSSSRSSSFGSGGSRSSSKSASRSSSSSKGTSGSRSSSSRYSSYGSSSRSSSFSSSRSFRSGK